MNTKTRSIKKGFTLAEVLVTIAIIAIMAAVLLPALNNQLSKGDTSRISSDLTNIQSGIQAFVSDLRRYPATTTQLINALPTGASSTDISLVAFSASDSAAWKGPYMSRDVLSNTGGRAAIATSFGTVTQSSTKFLSVNISPVTQAQYENLEFALDEGTTSSTSTTAGQIRYSSGSKVLTFLAMPIQ